MAAQGFSADTVVLVPALVNSRSGETVYGLQAKDFMVEVRLSYGGLFPERQRSLRLTRVVRYGRGALRRSPCLADIPQYLIQSLRQLVGALPIVRTPVVLPAL